MAAMTMAAANMLPNNSMNFTENQHGHAVLDTLRHQREQNAFCDVILHVQGQQFEAHRCVLAACSKYFQTMFKQEKVVKEQLTISCGGHEIFKCLLDYIYTGNVVIDKHNVSELVRLSNHFNVLKLRGHCSEYLERYLDVTNCLSVIDMAGKYQMAELLRTAVAFVKHNIDEVLRQQEAMELPHNKVEMLITDKELGLAPERQLTFILDWVRHSVSSRENELRQLLASTPLQLVERSRLQQLVQNDRLLAENERCLYFTLQSLMDVGVRLPAYEQLYSQMEEKYMQDLVVDNYTFMSMAISTAIEELEGTEATIFDGLHRLQQQAAVSSNQNPPPIETFSLAGIEDALGGGGAGGGGGVTGGAVGSAVSAAGSGEPAPVAEQETARDLRCHGAAAAAEPRYLSRYQDLLPPQVRYQECPETVNNPPPPPPPSGSAAPATHDKYQEMGVDGDIRYGAAVSDHARGTPRTAAARYRTAGDCHEVPGVYGSGAGGALVPVTSAAVGGSAVGDVQYMMVIKRPDSPNSGEKLSHLAVAAADGEDRRLDQGQSLGLQYPVYEYAPDPDGSGVGGAAVYCEQPGAPAPCRFEPPRRLSELAAAGEPVPADPRYPPVDSRALPLSARQARDQAVCYLPADGRLPYEPAAYVCGPTAVPLEPQPVPVTGPEPADGVLYPATDGRRAEPTKSESAQQDRFGEQPVRFSQEQGRFEETGQERFVEEHERFVQTDQVRFDEMAQGRFMEPEQGRFGEVEEARQLQQARFEQLEQTRFEQAEIARFEQAEQARMDGTDQVLVDQHEQMRYEPPAAPLPPPPPPLPMPAKKRKLDPGLAEELRNIHEQELRALHEQDQQALQERELRALHEPEYQPISDQELRAIQEEEFRAAHGHELRPAPQQPLPTIQERALEICEQEQPSAEPLRPDAAALLNVNLSPKKKRLRRQLVELTQPVAAAKPELGGVETADLAPLLAVPPAPVSPEPPPPPPLPPPAPSPPRERHYSCSRCQSVFTLRSALAKHVATKHRPDARKKTFMCNICETACDKKSLYVKHMLTHFEGPPYACSICFREFPVFPKFLRHRREHGENKPHRCTDCNLSFWKKCNLDHHMRIHTGEKPFRCDLCGATFTLSTTLKQHMNRHSTEKKHVCDVCNFSTKYANHLISHKKIHVGDIHRCSHAGCDYTTPKRSHLREHLQSHAKRRSHHCPHCQRAFNVKTHLSRHMRTHDESKKFRCTMCDYTVHRSDRLKSHMATHTRQVPKGRKPKGKKPKGQTPPAESVAEMELPTEAPLAADWVVF